MNEWVSEWEVQLIMQYFNMISNDNTKIFEKKQTYIDIFIF